MLSVIGKQVRRWFASISIGQALTLFDKGQLEYAKAELQRAIRIAPDHPQAHFHLGRIFSKQGRHEEAVSEFDRAIAVKKRFASALMARGLSRAECGDLSGAVSDCEKAVTLKKSYEHLLGLGSVLITANRLEEAESVLQQAVKKKPKEAVALSALGECRIAQGRYQDALDTLENAAKSDPKNAAVFELMGMCREKLGDFKAALQNYTRAGFADPKNAGYRCHAARMIEKTGDEDGAMISYQEGLQIDPECAEALIRLSDFSRSRDPEKARSYAERLVAAHPERWEGHYQLSASFAALGMEKEALNALKEALSKDEAAVKSAADGEAFSGLKGGYKFKNLLTSARS